MRSAANVVRAARRCRSLGAARVLGAALRLRGALAAQRALAWADRWRCQPPPATPARQSRSPIATSPAFATASCAARCSGRSIRPDPERPGIAIRYVVVPAMARRKFPDPVFLLAGGPGQSAMAVAARDAGLFAGSTTGATSSSSTSVAPAARRRSNVRDPATRDTRRAADPDRPFTASPWNARPQLLKLPYITSAAPTSACSRPRSRCRTSTRSGARPRRRTHQSRRRVVRHARRARVRAPVPEGGAAQRDRRRRAARHGAAGEFFDRRASGVRRPRSPTATRSRRAREPSRICTPLGTGCSPSCHAWCQATHPLDGRAEQFALTRDMVLGAVRSALYASALRRGLAGGDQAAARGRFDGLTGLDATFTARRGPQLVTGMHLSVVCAEDVPACSSTDAPGADFGVEFARCTGAPVPTGRAAPCRQRSTA